MNWYIYVPFFLLLIFIRVFADPFPPMFNAVPGNWMRNVHQRHGAPGDDNEFINFGGRRDVQRHELAVGKREFVGAASVEKPVPRRGDCVERGSPLHDPLCALLHRKRLSFSILRLV